MSWIKTNTRWNKKGHLIVLLLLLIALFSIHCGKLEGSFAFKRPFDDLYKYVSGIPEFKNTETIHWVFLFKKVSEEKKVAVILMKKELVWVELSYISETISKEKKILYGKIDKLEEGRYMLIIAGDDRRIAEKEFSIYTDEESEETEDMDDSFPDTES